MGHIVLLWLQYLIEHSIIITMCASHQRIQCFTSKPTFYTISNYISIDDLYFHFFISPIFNSPSWFFDALQTSYTILFIDEQVLQICPHCFHVQFLFFVV
jgi:hypothetical protein